MSGRTVEKFTLALIVSLAGSAFSASDAPLTPAVSLASLSVQRVFRETIPSVSDYSQTAHSQAKAVTIESDRALASPICGATICGPNSNWVMWDTPFLQFDRITGDAGNFGHDFRSSGFATGISRLFGEYKTLGLAIGYDERTLKGKGDIHRRGKGDAFHAALYGGAGAGNFFLDAYAGFSWTSQRTDRWSFAPAGRSHGNYNDVILSGGLRASYVWCLENEVRITPHLGFDYARLHNNQYTESNGSFVEKNSFNSAQLPIGVAVNRTFATGFLSPGANQTLLTPEIRAAFIPQFGSRSVRNEWSGGDPAAARKTGRFPVAIGAGLKVQINDRFILAVDYDCRFAKNYTSQVVTGTYGISF
ncbi:MAG: autotransporter outer membrane beta-barrel domain-containing protein [Planctomycetota bacterium]|jgi:outer membrane autotransporter protein|nr:autotransporter outer membrane beta-barrel domain-containing protein [Planctomycetota bacterium]